MSKENNQGCQMVGMLDIKGQDQCRRVYSVDGIAPTLTTSGGGQREVKIFDTKKLRVRKLTPKEYGILQAFPMEKWEQVVSDSQAYKQFGNAVTTTVFTAIAEAIATSIYEAEEREEAKVESKSKEIGMNPPINEETAAAVETRGEKDKKQKTEDKKNIEYYDLAKLLMAFLYDYGYIARNLYTTETTEELRDYIKENVDGLYIGSAPDTKRDWETAENAIKDILAKYTPDGYMGKIIYPVLLPLKQRLEAGERTEDLFNAIVEATR